MSTQIDLGPVLSVPKGDWNATTTYERLNMVRHNSAAWICNVATSTGVEPTEDSTDWYLQVKDTSSVTSVNGMKGDVVVELTETETPPANDNSNRIATTEWVTNKLGDVDLSGIKDDTILAAQNASALEVGTGELTSAELAAVLDKTNENVEALSNGAGFNAAGKAEIVGWGMPDYSAGITVGTSTVTASVDSIYYGSWHVPWNINGRFVVVVVYNPNGVAVVRQGCGIGIAEEDMYMSVNVFVPAGYSVGLDAYQKLDGCSTQVSSLFPLKGA